MTGDETENDPDPTTDAAAAAPAPSAAGGAPEAPLVPELSAAEQAVPDFDVPEPPSFEGAGSELPVPAAIAEEPVIPPPPVFEDEPDAAPSASRDRDRPTTRRAALRTQSAEPALPAVTYVDVAPPVPPASGDTNGYRGWTIAIYSGLAVLLFGAIGFMFVLAG